MELLLCQWILTDLIRFLLGEGKISYEQPRRANQIFFKRLLLLVYTGEFCGLKFIHMDIHKLTSC